MPDPLAHEHDGAAPGQVASAASTPPVVQAGDVIGGFNPVDSETEAGIARLFDAPPGEAACEQPCASHHESDAPEPGDSSAQASADHDRPAEVLLPSHDAVRRRARKAWTAALLASVRPRDHHVSDEEIYEVLNANGDDSAAALLAAKGVTLPMVCVWKVKYRHLTLDELRSARRNERLRRQLVAALVATVLGATASALVVSAARVVYARMTSAASAAEIGVLAGAARATDNATSGDSAPDGVATGGRSEADNAGAAHTNRPEQSRVPPLPTASAEQAEPHGGGVNNLREYRIQVAAPNTREEAREVLARLAAAGYPAYMSRAVVRNAEVFRVRLGPFETLESAEEVAARLRQDGFTGAWLVR